MTVPHTHSAGTSYLFLGARVGPAVEEGTDTDRKVDTQRDRGKREEKQRVCTQLHATSGDQYENARLPVTLDQRIYQVSLSLPRQQAVLLAPGAPGLSILHRRREGQYRGGESTPSLGQVGSHSLSFCLPSRIR